ncbi:hypothetical protein A3Q56_03827 [Intoshia linei]|uniref:Transmembrane 9 superfamily member n=1 Tax=Intoshia linei TaxID=1819745 RepID=A0A177B3T3_9BILA|nr:hypothetical protein A3Q56_03827 [Intoshia linei]
MAHDLNDINYDNLYEIVMDIEKTIKQLYPEQWVFGGVASQLKKCFIDAVPNRTALVLINTIMEYIEPGSIIMSDGWRFYTRILLYGFDHGVYEKKEQVILWYDSIISYNNRYDRHAYKMLDMCYGDSVSLDHERDAFSDQILGHNYEQSGLNISFVNNVKTSEICTKKFDSSLIHKTCYLLKNSYTHVTSLDELTKTHAIGEYIKDECYIYTDKIITIEYNKNAIVDYSITPSKLEKFIPEILIKFHYNVTWIETTVEFSHRHDKYIDHETKKNFHFSIFTIFFLSLIILTIGFITYRSLKKDYHRYNCSPVSLTGIDEYGWKLLYKDVFREPKNYILLISLVANGIHFVCCFSLFSLISSIDIIEFDSHVNRLEWLMKCYIFTTPINGFVGSHFCHLKGVCPNDSNSNKRRTNRTLWIKQGILSIIIFPCVIIIVLLVSSIFAVAYQSEFLHPKHYFTYIFLVSLYILSVLPVHVLSTILTRYLPQCKKLNFVRHLTISTVPRHVPRQRFILSSRFTSWFASFLAFMALYTQYHYVIKAFLNYQVGYNYGLWSVFYWIMSFMILSCSILSTYLTLNGENHRWHWPAFNCGFYIGFYTFIYSIYYYLYISTMSTPFQIVFYFLLMAVSSFIFSLICGALSFTASFIFIYIIYSSVKYE